MQRNEMPEYLTPKETAALLRVQLKTIWRWIHQGQIEYVRRRIGEQHRYLIPRNAALSKLELPEEERLRARTRAIIDRDAYVSNLLQKYGPKSNANPCIGGSRYVSIP